MINDLMIAASELSFNAKYWDYLCCIDLNAEE